LDLFLQLLFFPIASIQAWVPQDMYPGQIFKSIFFSSLTNFIGGEGWIFWETRVQKWTLPFWGWKK
jgi:hypothetical protein